MFGINKQPKIEIPKVDLEVITIPTDFYGGANPEIKFKTISREVDLNRSQGINPADKRALDKATAAGAGSKLHPASLLTNTKFLVVAGGSLFIVFLGAAGFYYWRTSQPADLGVNKNQDNSINGQVVQTDVTSTPEIIIPTATTTEEIVISTEGLLEFPSILSPEAPDMDGDWLSDPEEELFQTDPAIPDSDSDTHNDSHEVYNLFNPTGKEPMKLVESGLVENYTNPVFRYQIYFPKGWVVANVDNEYRDVLFSTITGEFVEVRTFDFDPNMTFNDWFAKWAPQENLGDLVEFKSVFKENGQRRRDYLTYYFMDQSHVYSVIYHMTGNQVTNYRTVIKMMARSFRLNGNINDVPAQKFEEQSIETIIPSNTTTSPVL